MSALTATQAPTTVTNPGDNQFVLHDHEKKTQVTLNMQKGGPLTVGETDGPIMHYQGPEGTFSFTDQQLETETTAIGKLFTVILNIVPDVRTLKFSLLLPAVIHENGVSKQHFDTVAMKSTFHTSLLGTPATSGANPSYCVVKLHGTGQRVEVPV